MQLRHARRVLAGASTAALLTLVAVPTAAAADDQGPDQTTEAQDDTDQSGDSLHPSGRDRDDHQDQRQGSADSDPDDDGRGPDRDPHGTDKPGDTGGVYDGDQDGNNGCGNDQDFEDDNEGWCGKPEEDTGSTSPEGGTETLSDSGAAGQAPTGTSDAMNGTAASSGTESPSTGEDAAVLGVTVERTTGDERAYEQSAATGDSATLAGGAGFSAESDQLSAAVTLPRTGVPAIAGLVTGLAAIGSGAAALRRGRR